MSFTLDPTTNRGKVRLLIGDTDLVTAANQIFSDAEIDAFLELESNDVYMAAAVACRGIAASAARSAIAWKSLDLSVDKKDVPKHFMALGSEFKARAQAGVPWEEIDAYDIRISDFGVDSSEYVGDVMW